MALLATEVLRGQGASARVTDADGRNSIRGVGGLADTAVASGSVTSAAAAGVLANLAGLVSGGVYEVEARITVTGTAETALRNIELRQAAVQLVQLPTLSAAGQQVFKLGRVTLTSTTVDLRCIATAVVGSVYTVVLVATRVE